MALDALDIPREPDSTPSVYKAALADALSIAPKAKPTPKKQKTDHGDLGASLGRTAVHHNRAFITEA